MVREIKSQAVTTFSESKQILDTGLRMDALSDDISCELIKIPLTCTLTIEKINTPVRGFFCTHFQCFDLKNFLDLTISSTNPRWLCPICKQPAYEFKIDSILSSILALTKTEPATEVMFLKNGEFKVLSKDVECKLAIHNIYDLPGEDKFKRSDSVKTVAPDNLKKKKQEIMI